MLILKSIFEKMSILFQKFSLFSSSVINAFSVEDTAANPLIPDPANSRASSIILNLSIDLMILAIL